MEIQLLAETHFEYLNLPQRMDRRAHMERELSRAGVHAHRREAINTGHLTRFSCLPKYRTMAARTPGAIGCHTGQVGIMVTAGTKELNAGVFEDDVVFCDDFQQRMQYISNWCARNPWDIIWLGGTYHVNPPWWHTGKNRDLPGSNLGRDAELTMDPRMVRTYGAFSTYAYIVNAKSIHRILHLIDYNVSKSMGVDWLFIKIQPQLLCYAFAPGLCKQYDNQSNIGKGITEFSGFAKLGAHWWQPHMEQFNPWSYAWGEANFIGEPNFLTTL